MDMHETEHARYLDLCKRIRAHCAERGWYGPEWEWTDKEEEHVFVASSALGAGPPNFSPALIRGCPYWWRNDSERRGYDVLIDRTHDPLRERFALPPATDAQIAATESALGMPLPPVLRVLYQELGNGGFGHGGGLYGVQGGWDLDVGSECWSAFTLDQSSAWYRPKGRDPRFMSLSDEDTDLMRPFWLELTPPMVPHGVIRLCDLGEGMEMCADLANGLVYHIEVGGHHDEQGNWTQIVSREKALTIAMWLNEWFD
jgi:hypothetical protein